MNELINILLKAFTGFFVLLLLTRIMGKKQLGQMNIFTYITGIVIGGITAEMIMRKDVKITHAVSALVLWCSLSIIIEFAGLKFAAARVVLDGEPSIIIKKGRIDQKQLRRRRLNMDDLSMLLRTNNIFSICNVDYAILEPNGDLSVLKKPEKECPTRQDMSIAPPQNKHLPSEIIVDGRIVEKNLKELGMDKDWLADELRNQNVNIVNNVLYAELQSDGTLYIQLRN